MNPNQFDLDFLCLMKSYGKKSGTKESHFELEFILNCSTYNYHDALQACFRV